jgi:integrase
MGRRPEIGNVQLYPDRPLKADDKNGYVLKFYCPLRATRVRRNCGTRDRREARRILRECRERLLNGRYIESGGAITVATERAAVRSRVNEVLTNGSSSPSWQTCFDQYYRHRKQRGREKSLADAASRIEIAGRILDADRESRGLPPDGAIGEYATLGALEYLQERLLAGEEGRYDRRAPMSVNTMLGAVMAFLRYCKRHGWVADIPPLEKLDVEEVMKGRPITAGEFEQLLAAVPDVVGKRPAASWRFVLAILWESAFRVGDVMNFSWDDPRRIVPQWPTREGEYPTLVIPSSQKNKKAQEIPMLPGLQAKLDTIPHDERRGWIANPQPFDSQGRTRRDWFRPTADDLRGLVQDYSNSAIARACGVSETAVRKWLRENNFERSVSPVKGLGDVPRNILISVRERADAVFARPSSATDRRLTTEYVGRVIESIGEKAGVVVQQPDEKTGRRIKYASAHDLRRGCARRLINAGVSAETLKIVMRHQDFKTTERYYGAIRAVQAAAAEVHQKLVATLNMRDDRKVEPGRLPQLSPDEVRALKALLNSL